MDAQQRQQYLKELGLTQWVPRKGVGAASESRRGLEPALTVEPEQPADTLAVLDKVLSDSSTVAGSAVPVPEITGGSHDVSSLGWDALEQHLKAQPLRERCTQAVFGVGVREARLLVIGEAPGAEEDRRGEPFVGRAGQLLDRMLAAINFSRHPNQEQQGCYIANICKFRPPNNRDPSPEEIAADMPYLLRQIELCAPDLILAVGRIAAQTLLDSQESLGRLRQQQHEFTGIPLRITYHPAYLLRQPGDKAKAWHDLKRVRAQLQSLV